MENLQNFKLINAPPTVYYIPTFITAEEEAHVLKNVYSVPIPKWTCLSNRRLQDYGGVPHKNGMIVEKIPAWLETYMKMVTNFQPFEDREPNHVLVNEYTAGQGIMPHTDGPLFYPTVTTISCGSHTLLEFCENDDNRNKVCDILLEPRSLIIIQDDMYTKYLHYISEVKQDEITNMCVNYKQCREQYSIGQRLDRSTRVSLTIRNVLKVCKLKLWNL